RAVFIVLPVFDCAGAPAVAAADSIAGRIRDIAGRAFAPRALVDAPARMFRSPLAALRERALAAMGASIRGFAASTARSGISIGAGSSNSTYSRRTALSQ